MIESEHETEHYDPGDSQHYESSTYQSPYSDLEMTQLQLRPPIHSMQVQVGATNTETDARTRAELPTASSAQTTPGSPAPRSTPGPNPSASAPPPPHVPAPRLTLTHGPPPSVAPLTPAEQATRGPNSPPPLAPPSPTFAGATSDTNPNEYQNPRKNMHEQPDVDKRVRAMSTHEYDVLKYEPVPPVSERGAVVPPLAKAPPPAPPQEQQPKPKPRQHAPQSGPGLQAGASAGPNCPKNEEPAHVPAPETPATKVEAQHPKAPCSPLLQLPPGRVSTGHENSSRASGGSSQSAQPPIPTQPNELSKSNFCTPEQPNPNKYAKESQLPATKESAVGSMGELKYVYYNDRAPRQEYANDEIATHSAGPVVKGSESHGESTAEKKPTAASPGIAYQNTNAVDDATYEEAASNESGSTDEGNKNKSKEKSAKAKVSAVAKPAANAKRLQELEKLPQKAVARYIDSKRLPPRQSGELPELCKNVVQEMLAGVKNEHKLPVVQIAVTENAFSAVQTCDAKKRDDRNKKKQPLNAAEPGSGSGVRGVSREFPLDYISNWLIHSDEKRVVVIITMEGAATRYAASYLHAYFLGTDFDARRISHAIKIAFQKRSPPQPQPQPAANSNACLPVNYHSPIPASQSHAALEPNLPSICCATPPAAGGALFSPRNELPLSPALHAVNPLLAHNKLLIAGPAATSGAEKSPTSNKSPSQSQSQSQSKPASR